MSALSCKLCMKSFSKHSNLRSHVKKFHPGKVEDIAPNKSKTYNFQCENCARKFNHLHHLRHHQKNQHNSEFPQKNPQICPVCNYQDTKSKLISHFHGVHEIVIETEKKEFETLAEFNTWKLETEKNTHSCFIKTQGSYSIKNCTRTKYECHRSGFYQAKGKGLRHIKSQGTNKINGFCPAAMVVTSKNKLFQVEFSKTHVGHEHDLGHLSLSEIERKMLGNKITAKMTFSSILNEIKDSASNCNLERINLLTRKDLHNIKQCYKLYDTSVLYNNDSINMEIWINNMTSSGCVLFYKAQDMILDEYPNLNKEDFVMIIMNEDQLDILEKYGSNCICLDRTHALNVYGLELNTLLVLNEMREGVPCCFLISNRSDEEIMIIFFSCLKEKLGHKIKPKIFMSDMAGLIYKAWLQIMDPAEYRLYCIWHVDRDWQKNLNKINSSEKQVIVYKQLHTILQEMDKAVFFIMLQQFLNSLLVDEDTIEFARYFANYETNISLWAYCYRIDSGLHTSIHLERMHRTIKYLYLNGKHIKRLDKAINAILKFVRDKVFDQLMIFNQGKLYSKIKDIRLRHKASLDLNFASVKVTETGFVVLSSSSNQTHSIEERATACDCKLVCTNCQTCLHRYICSCVDFCIKWNMCKHIHLVVRYKQEDFETSALNLIKLESQISEDEDNLAVYEDNSNTMEVKEEEIEVARKSKESEILEVLKENLKHSLREALDKVTTFEKYQVIKKIMDPIHPTLDALTDD